MSERALETIEKLAKVLGVVVVVGTIAIAVALVVVNVSDDETPAPPPAEEQDEAPSGPIASIPGQPQDLRTTKRVWERYKERLIDHYDAIGGGVGADGIIIFLEDYADEPTAPQSVRGVAIRFMVTGRFRAQ